ncbi:hypothetical protein BpHYR1_003490 [Brachionus plicatilis]|uniref:Uncharacterized protein n=1 Tax=Brachionus plicatilis TaxID=10195 RepID=A0A3M7T0N9_BRAPC|nr:hypothetical protein BpHYR1_003490 [Brachionus plicatilis]
MIRLQYNSAMKQLTINKNYCTKRKNKNFINWILSVQLGVNGYFTNSNHKFHIIDQNFLYPLRKKSRETSQTDQLKVGLNVKQNGENRDGFS